MLKLACVNCGAPLEIGEDLDVFACGFCGSQQRVERKGGIVALKRVELAIKAVQRGTDRTAAELALPRLRRELAEVVAERDAAVATVVERRAGAARGRTWLALIVFFAILIIGPVITAAIGGASSNLTVVVSFVWIVACFALPIFVYRKTKLPADNSKVVLAKYNERIGLLNSHIQANRAILDQLPE